MSSAVRASSLAAAAWSDAPRGLHGLAGPADGVHDAVADRVDRARHPAGLVRRLVPDARGGGEDLDGQVAVGDVARDGGPDGRRQGVERGLDLAPGGNDGAAVGVVGGPRSVSARAWPAPDPGRDAVLGAGLAAEGVHVLG